MEEPCALEDKKASLVNVKFHMSANEIYRKLFPTKQPSRGDLSYFGRIITKHKFKQVNHEERKKYEVYFRNVDDSPMDWASFLQ